MNFFAVLAFQREANFLFTACVRQILIVMFITLTGKPPSFFFSEKEEENDEVEDMEVENSMECKLSLNSYKIRFVKGSEDYLYRRQALKRAKEVSTCNDFTGSSSRSILRDGRLLGV